MDVSKFKTAQQCRDGIEWLEKLKAVKKPGSDADGTSLRERNNKIKFLKRRLEKLTQSDLFPDPEQNPFPIKTFTPVTYDSK